MTPYDAPSSSFSTSRDEEGDEAALSPIERIRAAAALADKSRGPSPSKSAKSGAIKLAPSRVRQQLPWIASYQTLSKVSEALAAGADPNERDHEGRTALMIAAMNGLPKMMAILAPISDWHARDKEGVTALGHGAAKSFDFLKKMVAMLQSMPSSPGSAISRWKSDGALGGAAMGSALRLNSMAGHDMADWLATQGVDPNFRHEPEDLPLLSLAVDNRRVDLAQKLLAMGADPLALCAMRANRTALMEAATNGNAALTALLAPLGGAQMTDGRGNTALMLACARGNPTLVATLLPLSDRTARNNEGKDAIRFAFEASAPAAFAAMATDQEAWMTDSAGPTRLARMARDRQDDPDIASQLALKMTRSASASKSLLTLAKAWGVFESQSCPAAAQALGNLCDALAARLEIGAAASEPSVATRPRHSL